MKLWEYIANAYTEAKVDMSAYIALAHITPSGDGLRVVVKRPAGKTIEQAQQEWCEAMLFDTIGIKPDPACKDVSRISFAPMQREILYCNPSLLFADLPDAADYPDGTVFQPTLTAPSQSEGAVAATQGEAAQVYDTEYNGVPYTEIVERLEEQLGGRPEHGARNSFIFAMACNLRYICNDDAAWIASVLPTYGEDPQKHRSTVQSAVSRPMSRTMPEPLARALRISTSSADVATATMTAVPPPLPGRLPAPVSLLTSRTPADMKPAVAMAVFPPLGAHLVDTRFTYWDGRDYEPSFMNVLVAELSAGKSAVNAPIQHIVADIKARDMVARTKLQAWRDACAGIASTKDKPERPKGLCVQCLSPDMTNAAFVQRLADAEGHFLYTQMDEIGLLNALKTNTQRGPVSLLAQLPKEFTKQQVQELRVANGMKPNPSNMLRQWVHQGLVCRGVNDSSYVKALKLICALTMARFCIQAWAFGELAQRYYPEKSYDSALRLFRREIYDTRGLWKVLQATGFKECTKVLTRSQVQAIVRYLGEP